MSRQYVLMFEVCLDIECVCIQVCVCEWLALVVIDNCVLRFVLRYFARV